METDYCPNCGSKVEEGDKFCRKCGKELIEKKPITAIDQAKIVAIQEKIREYKSLYNWMLVLMGLALVLGIILYVGLGEPFGIILILGAIIFAVISYYASIQAEKEREKLEKGKI